MYKEIKNDYPEFVAPKHGYVHLLFLWFDRLLINTCYRLTVIYQAGLRMAFYSSIRD